MEKIFSALPHICARIQRGDSLAEADRKSLLAVCGQALTEISTEGQP